MFIRSVVFIVVDSCGVCLAVGVISTCVIFVLVGPD